MNIASMQRPVLRWGGDPLKMLFFLQRAELRSDVIMPDAL